MLETKFVRDTYKDSDQLNAFKCVKIKLQYTHDVKWV